MKVLPQVRSGLAVAALALAFFVSPAQAYQVVAFPDFDSQAMFGCSLREAIETLRTATNVDTCVLAGSPGNNEILLVQGVHTFPITIAGNNDDLDASGDFDIRDNLTITGDGAANSTIDGNNLDRVFDVQSGVTLTLRDLTVTHGKAPNGAAAGASGAKGGGIRATGELVLNRVVVTANAAGNGGAGVNASPGQDGGLGGEGGGVYSLVFASITDSVISFNTAGNGGSGGSAAGACSTPTNGGNGGPGGGGGGITAGNSGATITGSTITGNMSGLGGAGGCASNPGSGGNGGSAGGLFVSFLTLTNSVVSDNQTRVGGLAGLDGDTANTKGSGRGGDGGGIYAFQGATISSSTISGNVTAQGMGNAPGTGGTGQGNWGGDGGGALLQGDGSITNSTFSNNHTGNGAVSTTTFAGGGGKGGALALPDPDGGFSLTPGYVISKSTFNNNFTGIGANSPTQPGDGGAGGAIFVGNTNNPRHLSIADSTLTGNSTGAGGNRTTAGGFGGNGGRGGAISVGDRSTVDLTHLTIADNTTGIGGTTGAGGTPGTRSDGGAIDMYGPSTASTATVKNSILASNAPATCGITLGTLTDGGHNLVFGTQCADITAFSTADPLLAALANNGGPTQTRAIGDTSPARDAVPATGAGCTATDQRGTTRPQGPACDAGAYEIFVPPPPDTGGTTPGGTTSPGATPTDTTPTTTPPPPASAPDVTKPKITLRIPKQTLRRIIKRGFACTFSTNEKGAATAKFGKFRTLRFTVKTVGKQRCVIKLSKKTKAKLAKLKTLKVTITITVKDAAGNIGKASKKLTLKH